MNKIEIPKSFKIFGQEWIVEFDDKLLERDGDSGQCRYRENKIVIQNINGIVTRPQSHLEQVFLHEIVHVILQEIDEHELRDNENFVQLFAHALHQIIQTMKYENK